MDINFDKLKAFPALTIIQIICGVIVPGFLFFYIYTRDLFMNLDLFRLGTLSISITFPIIIVNGFICHIGFVNLNQEDEKIFDKGYLANLYMGSLSAIPVIYTSIVIGYFFNLNLKHGIFTL